MYQLGSHWTDVCEIQDWSRLFDSVKENQIWLKFGKNIEHSTRRSKDVYIVDSDIKLSYDCDPEGTRL
jgi:hypothetical protein